MQKGSDCEIFPDPVYVILIFLKGVNYSYFHQVSGLATSSHTYIGNLFLLVECPCVAMASSNSNTLPHRLSKSRTATPRQHASGNDKLQEL
jgi:hypothetical protein